MALSQCRYCNVVADICQATIDKDTQVRERQRLVVSFNYRGKKKRGSLKWHGDIYIYIYTLRVLNSPVGAVGPPVAKAKVIRCR